MSLHEAGQGAAAKIGIEWREVPHDGRWHEVPVTGKGPRNGAGRIRIFTDGEGGYCWNHITGEDQLFWRNKESDLDPAALVIRRQRIEAEQRQAEEDRRQRAEEAERKAAALWKAGHSAQGNPYLERKGVAAVSSLRQIEAGEAARILGYIPKREGEALAGKLLIVPVKVNGRLASCQLIDGSGRKYFLAGGALKGGMWATGQLPQADSAKTTLLLCEGTATALSVAQATGCICLAAMSSGNLPAVASELRRQYPSARLIICGDKGNGEKDALRAATESRALLAIPNVEGGTDFNDLQAAKGLEEVKRQVVAAVEPIPTPCRADESAAGAKSESQEWPEPHPLPDGLYPVAAFDFELLPSSLRPWAQDICERVQCPPDFVAVGIMTGLGAVVGRKIGIRPQSKTDWTNTANQWGLIVGRPGVLKSPALEAAIAPLKRLVAQANETHAASLADYKTALQVAKLRAEAKEKEARTQLKGNPSADISALLAADEPEEPCLRRFIANDTSPAALGELLRQNPNGLLVFRDELVSLLKSLDREDQAEGRGFYLTGWNGDSGYTFDRIGRGMNLHIPAVCLSILGGTQPGRLSEYVRHAVKGGAADDGLIQRFGLTVWPDTGGEWKNVDRWPDGEAKRKAFTVFEYLDKLDPATIEAQQDRDIDGEPEGIPYLRFDEQGHGLFLEWRTDLESRLRGGDLHPAMESHLSKYRKLIPGLALILHLAEGNPGPIAGKATLQALAWGEYLESHARRVYGSVSQPETAAAKAILTRIRKGDLPAEFAGWQVWRPGWSLLSDREEVGNALRLLIDYGWLRETRRDDTGGRAATVYHVNPRGLQ
jgi:putative DNA primase/helicase